MTTAQTQTKKNEGWAFHVHHADPSPIEWCYDMVGRRHIIDTQKPMAERELRQERLHWVQGDVLAAFVQDYNAYTQALATFNQVGAPFSQALATYGTYGQSDARDQAISTFNQAFCTYAQARATYIQALNAAMPALVALHAAECPGCAWTPEHPSIFPLRSEYDSLVGSAPAVPVVPPPHDAGWGV